MKQIFINDNHLKEEDIDYEVIRVKALIVNHNDEILLAHNNYTYQFPGGHKDKEEDLESALQRELKEETGMDLVIDTGPFLQIKTYDNDYFNTGKKVENKIYYFRVFTDEEPDFTKTSYDGLEKESDFNLFYIQIQDLKYFINKSMEDATIDPKIGREMLLALSEYNELFGGIE